MKVDEFDDILYEMSNFNSKTTGLPSNISLWVRTEPDPLQHSEYRIKIKKDNDWAGIFLVGQNPNIVKNIRDKLSANEINQINTFIKQYASLIISLIDGKIDSAEFALEIRKIRGSNE